MPSFLRIPKVQLSHYLTFIYLTALIYSPTLSNLYLLFSVVGFTVFFDLLFTFMRKRVFFIPYAAIATGLIIALIIDPSALWYQIVVICAIAMGSKNFIRISGKHILNPAASGLFIGGIVLNLGVAWWGTSFQEIIKFEFKNLIFFSILLLPSLVSAYRMQRFGSILSFYTVYLVSTFILNPNLISSSFLQTLLNPSIIFFATVMLPEPMTSPVNLKRQIFYGVVIAIITFILRRGLFPDLLTPALLLGNILFFKYR